MTSGPEMDFDVARRLRLDGRVVVLTGASAGLGARFARVLDAAGARLLLVARRAERLTGVASQLREAHVFACDLADPASAKGAIDAAIQVFGRVDVLINNAGTNDPLPAEVEPLERFERVVAVNLTSPFALAQAAALSMLSTGGGAIVNVASMLGLVGLGRIPQAGYTASKGGLVNMTRELAAQWARRGIRVNALAPGWFLSELTEELVTSEQGAEWIRRNTPMGRPGAVHELDAALVFLASDASTYMTGQVLVVDGGWTAV